MPIFRRILVAVLTIVVAGAQMPATPAPMDPGRQWLERLKAADDAGRLDIAYDLRPLVGPDDGRQSQRAATAAATLAVALQYPSNPEVRGYVADALGELNENPSRSVPTLIAALADPDYDVSRRAAVALTKFRNDDVLRPLVDGLRARARSVPPVLTWYGMSSAEISRAVSIGKQRGLPTYQHAVVLDERTVPAEVGVTDRASFWIAFVLAQIGQPAVPVLDRFLDEPLQGNVDYALWVLDEIGTGESVQVMLHHLHGADIIAFHHLLFALPRKRDVMSALTKAARTETDAARRRAMQQVVKAFSSEPPTNSASPSPSPSPPPIAAAAGSPSPAFNPSTRIAVPSIAQLRSGLHSSNRVTVTLTLNRIGTLGSAVRELAPDVERLISPGGDLEVHSTVISHGPKTQMQLAETALVLMEQPPDEDAINTLVRVARTGLTARERTDAMHALASLGRGPQEIGPAFRAEAWDYISAEVSQRTKFVDAFVRKAQGVHWAIVAPGSGDIKLPEFTWPPPRYSTADMIDAVFNVPPATLADVLRRLRKSLSAANFSDPGGLFHIPGGFALATRMQQTADTWKPLPSEHRWDQDQPSPSNLGEYVAQLVRRPPGRFRVIVFTVNDQPNVSASKTESLSQSQAAALASIGARGDLPDSIGKLPFKGRHCFALIYEYKKRYGVADTNLQPEHTTEEHLVLAGIAKKTAAGPTLAHANARHAGVASAFGFFETNSAPIAEAVRP